MSTIEEPVLRYEDDETLQADISQRSHSRKTPSHISSAKFRKVPSECQTETNDELLDCILQEQILITELGAREEALSDSQSAPQSPDDEPTPDDDYESDLEIDVEEWMNRDKLDLNGDTTGEKRYMELCNNTGVIPISYFLRHIEDRVFRMRFHGLGPLGAKALSVPLKTNRNIQTLDLEGNWIWPAGAVFLADMLKDNVYITELNIAENKIGTKGATEMSDMLAKNDTLVAVDMSGNEIDDDGATAICNMLLRNGSLKRLYIRNNYFEEPAALCFKDVLCQNETLETLDLSWNRFRTRGAVAIAEGVQENVGLHTLDISMNGFGLDGAEAMGKALKVNRTLLHLNISNNRIPEEGAAHIAFGLITNDILKTLMIGCNPLARDGPMALLTALSKNDTSSMVDLNLENISVIPEFQELQYTLESERIFKVTHAGVIRGPNDFHSIQEDPLVAFKRDPMTKLKEYVTEAGYRLIDLFKDMDKDASLSVSKEEFISGIKTAGVKISLRQIDILLERLDADKNGEIDWRELLEGEKEYQDWKKEVAHEHREYVQEMEDKKDSSLFERIYEHEQVTAEENTSEET